MGRSKMAYHNLIKGFNKPPLTTYIGLENTGASVTSIWSNDYLSFIPAEFDETFIFRYPKEAWDAGSEQIEIFFTDENDYPQWGVYASASTLGVGKKFGGYGDDVYYVEVGTGVVVDPLDSDYYRCTCRIVRDATKVQFFLNGSETPASFTNGSDITGKTDFTDTMLMDFYSTDGYPYAVVVGGQLLHSPTSIFAPSGLTPDQVLSENTTWFNVGGQELIVNDPGVPTAEFTYRKIVDGVLAYQPADDNGFIPGTLIPVSNPGCQTPVAWPIVHNGVQVVHNGENVIL